MNIFSAQPSAANAASGDVLSADIQIAQVALTSPWTSSTLTALASVDLSARNLVLKPGTYWLSVVAIHSSFSTDMGILMSSFAGTPTNDNARQVGSSLWGGGGNRALNADAAFRLSGTVIPEPSTFVLVSAGLALLAGRRSRRSPFQAADPVSLFVRCRSALRHSSPSSPRCRSTTQKSCFAMAV